MNRIAMDDLNNEQSSSTYQAVIERRSSVEDVARILENEPTVTGRRLSADNVAKILGDEPRDEQSLTHPVVTGRRSSADDVERILGDEGRYEQLSTHSVAIGRRASAEDVAKILGDEPRDEQSLTHPVVTERRSSAEDVAKILGDERGDEQSTIHSAVVGRRSSPEDVARKLGDEPRDEHSSTHLGVIGRRSLAEDVERILADKLKTGRGTSVHSGPPIYADEHSREHRYSNLAPLPTFTGNPEPTTSKMEHPVTYSSNAQVDWPPMGVHSHDDAGQPRICSTPLLPNRTASEGMPLMGQDPSNLVRMPVHTMQTGGLEPAIALSSHGQNWPSMNVPTTSHSENEHFQSIHGSYDSQPPIAVSNSDQLQPAVHRSSAKPERLLSGGGTLTVLPGSSTSTDIFQESTILRNEPPTVLPLGFNDNQYLTLETMSDRNASPSCTATSVSNQVTTQKPLLGGNIQEISKEHVTHSGDKKKRFECHTCGLKFQWKSQLEIHCRLHTGDTPYKCAECPSRFTSKNNLRVHLRIHRGEKAFQCTECPARFTQKSNFKTHLITHSGQNPYKCDVCERTFSSNQSLQIHSRAMH